MKLISEYNEQKPLVESKDNGKKDYFIEGVFMQPETLRIVTEESTLKKSWTKRSNVTLKNL